MTDQNSGVEYQIRPEEAQAKLGIEKDAYYDRMKFLGFKSKRDKQGKVFITQGQFAQLEALGQYIGEHGKMEGFADSNQEEEPLIKSDSLPNPGGELATVTGAAINHAAQPVQDIPLGSSDDELDHLIRAASELAAQRMAMPQMIVGELSKRIGYDDLPEDLKQKVDQARENATPKHPSQLADQLLARYRQKAVTA
jgi:hypothetical protein